ncbi:transposable element Tcb1 transposase [Trichonephila clavipes]|nr:transposable element Tcb1 transposase [Trichonephila clavipes]
MAVVDFLPHENPPTSAGVEPATFGEEGQRQTNYTVIQPAKMFQYTKWELLNPTANATAMALCDTMTIRVVASAITYSDTGLRPLHGSQWSFARLLSVHAPAQRHVEGPKVFYKLLLYIVSIFIKAFVPSVHQSIETSIEEVNVKVQWCNGEHFDPPENENYMRIPVVDTKGDPNCCFTIESLVGQPEAEDKLYPNNLARQPTPTCLPELRRALFDEWCNIPQDQIDNLILSMPRHCKACIASSRRHTPY